jgi:hypothetical protein
VTRKTGAISRFYFQGVTIVLTVASKSEALRVTRVSPWTSEVAAMNASRGSIGWPKDSLRATSLPQASAISRSTGKILSPKREVRSLRSHPSRRSCCTLGTKSCFLSSQVPWLTDAYLGIYPAYNSPLDVPHDLFLLKPIFGIACESSPPGIQIMSCSAKNSGSGVVLK